MPTVQLTPRAATVEGVAIDMSGRPVSGAAVTLWSDGAAVAEAMTDIDGYYQVSGDLTGATLALLTVEREGHIPGGAVLTDLPGPGGRLSRSILLQRSEATLEGRVLDGDSMPVANVEVELVLEGRGAFQRTRSGADGSYRFELPLPDGAGWVWLRARPTAGSFSGSLNHRLPYVPLTRLTAGEQRSIDLLVSP